MTTSYRNGIPGSYDKRGIWREEKTLRVTFRSYSTALRKEFFNVEDHRSMGDAKLRACALNWQILKVEEV